MQPAAVGQQRVTVKPVERGKFILLRLQADCIGSEKEGLDPETKQANIKLCPHLSEKAGERESYTQTKKSMEEMGPKGRSRIQAGNCEEHMR